MTGLGHNHPLDAIVIRATEAMRDYEIGVAEEQAGRDDAIAAIVKYGRALSEGRNLHKSNNEFGDWIKARGLDQHRIFGLRQERSAAMQIAEIVAHVVQETVDSSSTVNPFAHCPNNRPTNIMTWWRGKHSSLLTMAHAKRVGERAARILQAHCDRIEEPVAIEYLEALARDPYAVLITNSVYKETVAEFEIKFGLRAAPEKPAAASAAPSPVRAAPAPPAGQKAVSPPPDRVQKAADSAEIATLKKEVWRLRDKLDQLAIYLFEKPPPKAEDRPYEKYPYWPLPVVLEQRPKDVAPRQIVGPAADDPAFALRREEFEQWLVRRKEALEMQYAAREAELAKAFEAKIKARVEARMAKEDANGRVYTEAQFMSIWKCLHPDSRKSASDKALGYAFRLLEAGRKRLVYVVDKTGKKQPFKPPVTPDPAPEPPQEERPSAGALS